MNTNTVAVTLDRGPRYTILVNVEDKYLLDEYLISTMRSASSYTRYVILRDKATRKYITLLHRKILNAPIGIEVDHKNGNGLDCTRYNIRFATTAQNQWNRRNLEGRLKGVTYRKDRGCWCACIEVNGVKSYLGHFTFEHEAIAARLAAEKKYYGEFAGIGTQQLESE